MWVCVCVCVYVHIIYVYIYSQYVFSIYFITADSRFVSKWCLRDVGFFSSITLTDEGWVFVVVQLFIWLFRWRDLNIFFSSPLWLNISLGCWKLKVGRDDTDCMVQWSAMVVTTWREQESYKFITLHFTDKVHGDIAKICLSFLSW